jgi:hypothetical protein
VSNGWIARNAQQPDTYYVTKNGRLAIQQKFSREILKKSVQSKPRRGRRGGDGSSDA